MIIPDPVPDIVTGFMASVSSVHDVSGGIEIQPVGTDTILMSSFTKDVYLHTLLSEICGTDDGVHDSVNKIGIIKIKVNIKIFDVFAISVKTSFIFLSMFTFYTFVVKSYSID